MKVEVFDKPIQFHLYGYSSRVGNKPYSEVGFQLMNDLWKEIKNSQIETTGINHWVYLADGGMFVGVEVKKMHTKKPVSLAPLAFELRRYCRHVHIGTYQALPQKWEALKSELVVLGETIASPSLEIYGHHCDDPSMAETTILIALKVKT